MKYRIVKQEDGRYRVEQGYPVFVGWSATTHWSYTSHLCIFSTLAEAEAKVEELRKPIQLQKEEVVKVYED